MGDFLSPIEIFFLRVFLETDSVAMEKIIYWLFTSVDADGVGSGKTRDPRTA